MPERMERSSFRWPQRGGISDQPICLEGKDSVREYPLPIGKFCRNFFPKVSLFLTDNIYSMLERRGEALDKLFLRNRILK